MNGAERVTMERICGAAFWQLEDSVATEEPLELLLEYGPREQRARKAIAVMMRTPGHDEELAAGFLWSEGVLDDPDAIQAIDCSKTIQERARPSDRETSLLPAGLRRNHVLIRLHEDATVRVANLERNFYTTSSCGVCGKASLQALRVLMPPRAGDHFRMRTSTLVALPPQLRAMQELFSLTGGLHGAALVTPEGEIVMTREDVGRHNAVDKLIGAGVLQGSLPFRSLCLLLSGRVSFELMQKAVMAGIPFVAAVGAPSSLAVQVAREFDTTLVGFLKEGGFNVYAGFERLTDRPREEMA